MGKSVWRKRDHKKSGGETKGIGKVKNSAQICSGVNKGMK